MISRSVVGRLGCAGFWINFHSADWIGHPFTAVAMMSVVLSVIAATRVRRCLAFTARTRFFV